jgi:hypothetical protein
MKYLKTFESFSPINEEEEIFGKARKFITGHESSEDRNKAMVDFHKALDEAEAKVKENPESYVFKRETLEKQAAENNYLGGIRIQQGGRDKSRLYVVYDEGATGFEELASAAGGETNIRK